MQWTLLAAVALVMCGLAPATAFAVTSPEYSVYTVTLTATNSYTNPYTGASVTSTWSGPGGAQKIVSGYWDGGSTWRIRFTPTSTGTWTYTTSSSDPGLNNKTGSLMVTSPDAGNHGFLRVDAAHPYSFVWDDGTRFFMWGYTAYDIIRNAVGNGHWRTMVTQAKATGFTKIRFLVYPGPNRAPRVPYPEAQPFIGPTNSPDHDRLNIPFWRNLDAVVEYFQAKGMVADLIIAIRTKRVFGTQAQDDRYFRYIIARYAAFDNVIWDLSNEWEYTKKPASYFDHMGSIFRKEDPWMANGSNLRPLSTHQETRIDFEFFGSTWPTYAMIQYGVRNHKYKHGDEWGNAGIVYNLGHNMPVADDEYGYVGESHPVNLTRGQHRRVMWGIAVAGGYGTAGDDRRFADGATTYDTGDWKPEPEWGDVTRLVSFFTGKGIEYWKMSEVNSIVSGTRVYALAEAGRQYVIYAAVGGTFSVTLPTGAYDALRYDPRTGAQVLLGTVKGGTQQFTMPNSDDWVVWLKARGGRR